MSHNCEPFLSSVSGLNSQVLTANEELEMMEIDEETEVVEQQDTNQPNVDSHDQATGNSELPIAAQSSAQPTAESNRVEMHLSVEEPIGGFFITMDKYNMIHQMITVIKHDGDIEERAALLDSIDSTIKEVRVTFSHTNSD